MDNSKKIYALLFQRCSLELPTFQHRFNSNNDTVYFTDPPIPFQDISVKSSHGLCPC